MKKNLIFLAVMVLVLGFASIAQAQATRTWVSGVGDDANPCSRTAPCKTFAGAISKTAAGGTISVLDPGGYGAVTITKAITIDGTGQIASALAAGTNGIVINAGANDNVVLRNIDINGAGTGFDGVRILSAKSVTLDGVNIQQFTSQGMEILPTVNPVKVHLRNCQIRNNTSHGILVIPVAPATVQLTVEDSHFTQNQNAIDVAGQNNSATIVRSVISNNAFGLVLEQTLSTMFAESTVISYNGTGILSGAGANTPTVRISRCMIVGSTTNGIASNGIGGGAGNVVGFQNNVIIGNTGNQALTSSSPQV